MSALRDDLKFEFRGKRSWFVTDFMCQSQWRRPVAQKGMFAGGLTEVATS